MSGEVRGGEAKGLLPLDPGLCQHLAAPVPSHGADQAAIVTLVLTLLLLTHL